MKVLWVFVVAAAVVGVESLVGTPVLCRRYTLRNGRTRYRQRGRFVKFLCNAGYSLYGDAYSTCHFGKWDIDSPPICVKNSCKPYNKTPNNMLIYPEKNGAVLNFICHKGYALNGANKTYCDGKQWQNNMPSCLPTDTEPPRSCDFEKEDICGWTHDLNHDFDWRRLNYFTPSGQIGTGPTYDHTKGPGMGGYYMYIESSTRNENDTARLLSPIYGKITTNVCFEFYYHMYGSTIGTLRVYLKKVSESYSLKESRLVFEMSGNQGNHWFRHFVQLGPIDEEFQIIIEGVRGKSYVSDIAIDDVSLIENCQPQEEPTSTIYPTDDNIIPELQTCENRCGQNSTIVPTINVIQCDCDDDCWSRSQCCPDYYDHCLSDSTTDLSTTTEEATTEKPTTLVTTTTTKLLKTSTTTRRTTITSTTTTTRPTTRSTTTRRPTTVTKRPTTLLTRRPTTLLTKRPTTLLTRRPTTLLTRKPTTLPTKRPTTLSTKKPTTFITSTTTESDFNSIPINTKNVDYFEENYHDEIDHEISLPHPHFTKHSEIVVPQQPTIHLIYVIVGAVVLLVLLTVVVATIVVKRGGLLRGRMGGHSSDSQSDVRFLTGDEVLDFTLARDYDDL